MTATYGGFENVRPIVSGGRAFRNSFLEGKLSSLFDGIWMFLIMEAQAPDVDWGVAHVPYNDRNPAARTQYMIEGAWGYAIPTGVKNPGRGLGIPQVDHGRRRQSRVLHPAGQTVAGEGVQQATRASVRSSRTRGNLRSK